MGLILLINVDKYVDKEFRRFSIVEKIVNYYSSFDEWGRLDREPIEFIVNSHYIKKFLPANGRILDNGAGPGKYSLELARFGYEVTLTDLTPRLVEIAKSKAQEQNLEQQFNGFHVADAKDLHVFQDEQFDGSLMLGPLYHLQSEADRVQAVQELHRVTKKQGIVFVAFMSRVRHLTTSVLYPQAWKPNHTVEGVAEFLDTGIFNHSDEGRFTGAYFFNIADINPFMEANGFETLGLVGSGSIAGGMKSEQWDYWRAQGEEEYKKIIDIIIDTAADPYILGASSHLLYIGRKQPAIS
jgi:ubiquinone/menaquinone biosynthesis C-methylase UbiE